MTLRVKFVLALLIVSLGSVSLVGGVAYWQLMRRFNDRVLHESARHFMGDVMSYYRTYGSWEKATAAERFHDFVIRRKVAFGGGAPTPEQDAGMPMPKTTLPPPSAALTDGPQKPPPAEALPPPPGAPGTPGGPDPGPGPGPGSGPPGKPIRNPPFRFLLLDVSDHVVIPNGPYHHGDLVHDEDRKVLMPVMVEGAQVGSMSPQGQISYSATDLDYIDAMRSSLLIGCAAATVLALALGIGMGAALSRPLRRLTVAIQAMELGTLGQLVEVTSNDEVGVLATAFNHMSDQLNQQHQRLRESYGTIQEQANHLRELSIRDALTQLYNRRHFDEQGNQLYEQATRYGRPLSVMIGDIDFFKRINDGFSHAMGDSVLRQIGLCLREHTRASDVVARYGGEEFVIAFPETPLPVAVMLCERLRQAIEAFDWTTLHPNLAVTMSMGVDGDLSRGGLEAMLNAADGLLYQAKHSGRNRVCSPLDPAAAAEEETDGEEGTAEAEDVSFDDDDAPKETDIH